jgi:hypothetical protein
MSNHMDISLNHCKGNLIFAGTLAAHGLEELFSSCAVVSCLVLAGNRFWFYLLCTYVLRVQYSCGVVLVFWFWREIVFGFLTLLLHIPLLALTYRRGDGIS